MGAEEGKRSAHTRTPSTMPSVAAAHEACESSIKGLNELGRLTEENDDYRFGRPGEAEAELEQAMALALVHRGNLFVLDSKLGGGAGPKRKESARRSLVTALELLRKVGDTDGEMMCLRVLARLSIKFLGDASAASEYIEAHRDAVAATAVAQGELARRDADDLEDLLARLQSEAQEREAEQKGEQDGEEEEEAGRRREESM